MVQRLASATRTLSARAAVHQIQVFNPALISYHSNSFFTLFNSNYHTKDIQHTETTTAKPASAVAIIMKYFTEHLPSDSHTYTLPTRNHNEISTGLQGTAGTPHGCSRQTLTKESDNAYIKRIEAIAARTASETSHKREYVEMAIWERLRELVKKTSHCLQKEPSSAKPAKKSKESGPAYGEYSIPYVFW